MELKLTKFNKSYIRSIEVVLFHINYLQVYNIKIYTLYTKTCVINCDLLISTLTIYKNNKVKYEMAKALLASRLKYRTVQI